MRQKTSNLEPLTVHSLRERAESAIRTSIATGEMPAGEIFPVSYFAERLRVSATPVREALLNLASQMLVESVRNRGFRVPMLSDQDLDEIFAIRLRLEVPTMAEVALRIGSDQSRALKQIVDRIRRSANMEDLPTFLEEDRHFHLGLLEVLGNRRLVELVRRLRDETRLYGLRWLPRTQLIGAADEHASLLEAVANGDGQRAQELARLHLEHTRGVWADAGIRGGMAYDKADESPIVTGLPISV